MKKHSLVPVIAIALAGCAQQQPLLKQTASGYPEATISGVSVDEVRSRLMEACTMAGALVQEAAANTVLCGKTLSGGEAFVAQLAIGNSYSTTPERKIRFTIFQLGTNARVTAQQWIETQMAFGQMRRMELNGNDQRNNVQAMLDRLAGPSVSATPTNWPSPDGIVQQAPATAATLTPAAAKEPSPAAPGQKGQDGWAVEKMSEAKACSPQPRAVLTGKGPGFESYTVACMSGDQIMVRCEFGNCRVLK